MRFRSGLLVLFAVSVAPVAWGQKTLDIHFIDTEGGQATLLVTPAGESILIDAGFPGYDGRDSDRIVATAKRAGLKHIDYVVVTHYHLDHVGGVPELAAKFPVRTFVDHGSNTETSERAQQLEREYQKVLATGALRLTVKAGDRLALKGVQVDVIAARGERSSKPLGTGGQPNPLCAGEARKPGDPSENARSIGMLFTYGQFRFVNLGDLTWNKELELACPEHFIGPVDLYLTTHHGLDQSGPKAIVHGLRPRVAIMNNGARKGGAPGAWSIVASSPGLEDLWQLHHSIAGGAEHNVAEARIANMEEKCAGHGLEVRAEASGAFTVRNLRNGHEQRYRR